MFLFFYCVGFECLCVCLAFRPFPLACSFPCDPDGSYASWIHHYRLCSPTWLALLWWAEALSVSAFLIEHLHVGLFLGNAGSAGCIPGILAYVSFICFIESTVWFNTSTSLLVVFEQHRISFQKGCHYCCRCQLRWDRWDCGYHDLSSKGLPEIHTWYQRYNFVSSPIVGASRGYDGQFLASKQDEANGCSARERWPYRPSVHSLKLCIWLSW